MSHGTEQCLHGSAIGELESRCLWIYCHYLLQDLMVPVSLQRDIRLLYVSPGRQDRNFLSQLYRFFHIFTLFK